MRNKNALIDLIATGLSLTYLKMHQSKTQQPSHEDEKQALKTGAVFKPVDQNQYCKKTKDSSLSPLRNAKSW